MSAPSASSGSAAAASPSARRCATSAASSAARRITAAPAPPCCPMMNQASPDLASPRVLILAPTGRDGTASADLLRRAALAAEVCADLGGLLDGLEAGADAVFI